MLLAIVIFFIFVSILYTTGGRALKEKTCVIQVLLFQRALIPVVELLHTILDFHLVVPSEAVELAHVDELARCAIWFCRVPDNLTLEADRVLYEVSQGFDGKLLASTHVDVAVADLSKRRDGATAPFTVIAVHLAISLHTIEYR